MKVSTNRADDLKIKTKVPGEKKFSICIMISKRERNTQCVESRWHALTGFDKMYKQSEMDTEQQTGSKLGKEYDKAKYCHLVYLTYRQSISRKMLG